MNVPPADTYEGQLAQRAAELLPGIGTPERLELLAVMDEDDLRTSLAFIATLNPAIFDAALVRDRKMTERLTSQLAEAEDPPCDEEPFCQACGATAGIFLAHGDSYIHFRGEGTVASPVELFDAGHEPVIAWRPAGAPAVAVDDETAWIDYPAPHSDDCDCESCVTFYAARGEQ